MKLIRDHSPGAYAITVYCIKCQERGKLSEMLVDTEGPAFKAYYHAWCLPEGTDLPTTCNRYGCARGCTYVPPYTPGPDR